MGHSDTIMIITMLAGTVFTTGGFLVEPRSQAPAFF